MYVRCQKHRLLVQSNKSEIPPVAWRW